MKSKTKFFILTMTCLSCLLVGCASSPVPPKLSKKEAERLSELPLQYSVGVEAYKYPVYSERLLSVLQHSGVFKQVSPLSEMKGTPDFVARVEETIHGAAVIPIFTFASAGLIPTVVDEDHGVKFSLTPGFRGGKKLMVDASYSGTTTLGWAAIFMNLLPNFTSSEPEESERFHQMLSYRILSALHPDGPS